MTVIPFDYCPKLIGMTETDWTNQTDAGSTHKCGTFVEYLNVCPTCLPDSVPYAQQKKFTVNVVDNELVTVRL